MSALKAWQEDTLVVSEGAMVAAGMTELHERMAALRVLFGHIGKASERYYDPHTVRVLLVRKAVTAYRAARAARVLEGVGV